MPRFFRVAPVRTMMQVYQKGDKMPIMYIGKLGEDEIVGLFESHGCSS